MAPALDDVGRHEGLFLKIAAITMMHEEHAMLAKWHDHYGRLVGPENPYVVSHGRDDRHREITPEASHITVPRDILKGFEGRRQRSLADLQKSLSLLRRRSSRGCGRAGLRGPRLPRQPAGLLRGDRSRQDGCLVRAWLQPVLDGPRGLGRPEEPP